MKRVSLSIKVKRKGGVHLAKGEGKEYLCCGETQEGPIRCDVFEGQAPTSLLGWGRVTFWQRKQSDHSKHSACSCISQKQPSERVLRQPTRASGPQGPSKIHRKAQHRIGIHAMLSGNQVLNQRGSGGVAGFLNKSSEECE